MSYLTNCLVLLTHFCTQVSPAGSGTTGELLDTHLSQFVYWFQGIDSWLSLRVIVLYKDYRHKSLNFNSVLPLLKFARQKNAWGHNFYCSFHLNDLALINTPIDRLVSTMVFRYISQVANFKCVINGCTSHCDCDCHCKSNTHLSIINTPYILLIHSKMYCNRPRKVSNPTQKLISTNISTSFYNFIDY